MSQTDAPPYRNAGFTLVEVLVVIAIIAVLAALLLPVASRVMEKSRRAKCATHLQSLTKGVLLYMGEHGGKIPYVSYQAPGAMGYGQIPWGRAIAPYLDTQWTDDQWRNWTSSTARRGLPDIYYCPSDPGPAAGVPTPYDMSYGINVRLTGSYGVGGVNSDPTRVVTVDKLSETIVLADGAHAIEDGDVAHFISNRGDKQPIARRHNGGANIAWLDGHVSQEPGERLDELTADTGQNAKYWAAQPKP